LKPSSVSFDFLTGTALWRRNKPSRCRFAGTSRPSHSQDMPDRYSPLFKEHTSRFFYLPLRQSASISRMTKALRFSPLPAAFCAAVLCCSTSLFPSRLGAQTNGALDIVARITPTAAHPEPVRDFTFYVLTKSYADICKEVASGDIVPPRDKFIDGLDVTNDLKEWMKAHDVIDLAQPDLDKMVTVNDVMKIPEFLAAYQRSNSGGVTKGMPKPKFTEQEKTDHPDKYEKDRNEYLAELKKFIQQNPATIQGIELELDGVNPQRKWALLNSKHKNHLERFSPELAQTKYLAAKFDTDLDGHAVISNLPPGNYWISSLNLEANAGDARERWDVPITVLAGQTVRIELTNLNAADMLASTAP
jgi:hypothetical protein